MRIRETASGQLLDNLKNRRCAMGKSHAAAWAPDSPTPDQLKEFFAQISSGRITKQRLQPFLRGNYQPTTSQKRAREIMGKNFFGVEEAIRHYGVEPTQAELSALAEIPFTETTLQECGNTHVLVAVFPLSILEIRDKVAVGQRLFYDQDWYNKQVFANEKGETEWRLVRKTPVVNSTSKTWPEQQALLANNEETPSTRVMVYTIIGHFLSTAEQLFENTYVRCSCVDSDGSRVFVGNFCSHGLYVNNNWDDLQSAYLGLGSARKID